MTVRHTPSPFEQTNFRQPPILGRSAVELQGFLVEIWIVGFIWTRLRLSNCGDFRVSFLVVYRWKCGFYLKEGCALPFSGPKELGGPKQIPTFNCLSNARASLPFFIQQTLCVCSVFLATSLCGTLLLPLNSLNLLLSYLYIF